LVVNKNFAKNKKKLKDEDVVSIVPQATHLFSAALHSARLT